MKKYKALETSHLVTVLALNKESEKESVKECLLYQILISTYSVSGFYFPDKMIMTQTHSDKQK